MQCFLILNVIIFVLTSIFFVKQFSKGRFDSTFILLNRYAPVQCPAGYKLYRFVGERSIYVVQTQEPLVHGTTLNIFLRKCDILVKSNGSTCDSCYFLTAEEESVLTNVCQDFRYITESSCKTNTYSEIIANGKSNVFFIQAYMAFPTYRPEVSHNTKEEEKSEDMLTKNDNWDVHTLLVGIFPGTLWCGFGNIANDVYTNLGRYSDVDKCCRTHDLCKPKIRPWKTRYHYDNQGIIPLSHCSCDLDFFNCLKKTNSTESNRIGHIFFNLAKIPCFDFQERQVCAFSLFGWCFYHKMACAAVTSYSPDY